MKQFLSTISEIYSIEYLRKRLNQNAISRSFIHRPVGVFRGSHGFVRRVARSVRTISARALFACVDATIRNLHRIHDSISSYVNDKHIRSYLMSCQPTVTLFEVSQIGWIRRTENTQGFGEALLGRPMRYDGGPFGVQWLMLMMIDLHSSSM